MRKDKVVETEDIKPIMTCEYEFLPEVGYEQIEIIDNTESMEIICDSKCPCCGYLTIPNKGDANAYICPVCMWEIDLFIKNCDESSDLNNGLSLKEAIKNYKEYGAVLPRLKEYCREPKEYE